VKKRILKEKTLTYNTKYYIFNCINETGLGVNPSNSAAIII
jgi:hypothetical protein